MSKDRDSSIANNANKVMPQASSNAATITAVEKKSGEIVGYQLSNGKTVTVAEGVEMAKNGGIKGVAVAENQGYEYLRSKADNSTSNNLDSLPTITQ